MSHIVTMRLFCLVSLVVSNGQQLLLSAVANGMTQGTLANLPIGRQIPMSQGHNAWGICPLWSNENTPGQLKVRFLLMKCFEVTRQVTRRVGGLDLDRWDLNGGQMRKPAPN